MVLDIGLLSLYRAAPFFYTAGMKPSTKSVWNPARLDVRAFAKARQEFGGPTALSAFDRLQAEVMPGVPLPNEIGWRVQGECRQDAQGREVPWLHLTAEAVLPVSCQRCLGPVATHLAIDRWFRFVEDEATAALEDEECEEDVLALEPRPNLIELLEDELLMALPLVPMHETCPEAVPMQAGQLAGEGEEEPVRESPFAQLARLKR
ncbi:MAG: YceD family protein [Burkholderiaceae bacterium]